MNQIGIHAAIKRCFPRIIAGDDNMPICVRGTRNDLAACWNVLGYKKGVEVGVHRAGYSCELLRQIPDCHLTCVDPWVTYLHSHMTEKHQQKYLRIAKSRLDPYVDKGRATIMRMTSMEAVTQFEDESLDFVFIDGNHLFDYCCSDIIFWSQKMVFY